MIENAVVPEAYKQSGWMPYLRRRRLPARHQELRVVSLQKGPFEDAVVESVPIEEPSSYGPPPTPMEFPLEARADCQALLSQLLEVGHLDERGTNRAAARLGFRAGLSFERASRAYALLLEHGFMFRCRSHDWWLERTQPLHGQRLAMFLAA